MVDIVKGSRGKAIQKAKGSEVAILESVAQTAEQPFPAVDDSPLTFRFEATLGEGDSPSMGLDAATIYVQFRHFHTEPILFQPGVNGAFNIGIRVMSPLGLEQIFEDRMVVGTSPVAAGKWSVASVRIPRSVITIGNEYIISIDIVKEGEYWFSTLGQSPMDFTIKFMESRSIAKAVPQSRATAFAGLSANDQNSQQALSSTFKVNIVFDVSDLIQYFRHARLPTGIQRVQIEVITNVILADKKDIAFKIGSYSQAVDSWIEIPQLFFINLCKLALVDGNLLAPEWLAILQELESTVERSRRLIFSKGAYLINLGTSWWLQNYFLNVRAAKARYGIRYIPYVHDCIPIMTPEHCVENLTRDFITWALGVFQHADHIIVNSHSTLKDVRYVAGVLDQVINDPVVVTLDADYRASNAQFGGDESDSGILQANDLRAGAYVLFVSTIESRKNHLLAFSAFLALIKKYGARRVPKLVCVGNRGWLNDAIYSKLSASKLLQEQIVLLSRISDPDLEHLYKNCLFTLYPSCYEGWGLPVTESLCFGKVPVLANSSSLPEAGGEFGEYFELGSENALINALERMIFDEDYRRERERVIVERFRPRPWAGIADNIVDLITNWAVTDHAIGDPPEAAFANRGVWPFPVTPGRYYGLVENGSIQIWPGMVGGEMFRQGDNWWWPEPWGCWTKSKGARLAFVAPLAADKSAIVFIGVRGVQRTPATISVRIEGGPMKKAKADADQDIWLVLRVTADDMAALPRSRKGILFEVNVSSDSYVNFAEFTDGKDHRVAGVGVRGFMVCAADDLAARIDFMEKITTNDFTFD